jgi:hypothetical protein
MKKLKLIALFVAGFVLGGIAVSLWWGHIFSRMTVSKEVEVAFTAAREADWLALLRLNEPEAALKDMENTMDLEVATICQWAEAQPPDEKTRKARDAFLTNVKVYHESYPPKGDEAARISALLSTTPGRSPDGHCKSGVCRLDDLRLSKLRSPTNSP